MKRGIVGPKLDQKGEQKAGLQLLAKGDDAKYFQKVLESVDGILGSVDSQASELPTLVAQLQKGVHELEEQCGVTVELPEADKTDAADNKALANPLDAIGLDAAGDKKPEAAPAGKPPAAKPAEAKPRPAAPPAAKPAESKPAATEPANVPAAKP